MNNIISLAISAILLTSSCGNTSEKYAAISDDSSELKMAMAAPEAFEEVTIEEQRSAAPVSQQMLIKTAHINIEVRDYNRARFQVDSLSKHYRAWVSSENMYNYDNRITGNIAVRVPAVSLEKLIGELISIGIKLESQQVESTDVTEEYIDSDSRLSNQRAVEKKFVALLKQANSIDEILKIETKLAEIRGIIESYEGRLKYLNDRVKFSTINLNMYQKIDFKYVPEPIESFWERFKKSVYGGWKGLVSFLLFLVGLWPLWIAVAFGSFLISRFATRRRKPSPGAEFLPEKKKGKRKDKHKEPKASKTVQVDNDADI